MIVGDARGDVVNLTDSNGNVVASYTYDTWGNLTSASESIPNANGWVNPFRFDGRDGARYDASTGLDWMRVRAYDPSVGRFLSRDPLGRAPLFFADNPYVYAGNNPLSNVDPSGQYRAAGFGSTQRESAQATKQHMARVARMVSHRGTPTATAPACSPSGGAKSCLGAGMPPASINLHPVTVAKMTLRFSALPSFLDPQAGWDFAFAILAATAGIAAIAAAGATFATVGAAGADPVGDLVAIVLFLNGIDAFIHAAAFGAKAIWGPGSGIANMLEAFAVIADLVITLMDAATIALLLTPASIGAIVAPLASNAAALTTIYTLTGVDLAADLADLKDLLGA